MEKYPNCFFCGKNDFKEWIHGSGSSMTMLCINCLNHKRNDPDWAWIQFWFRTKEDIWADTALFSGFRVCQEYEINFQLLDDHLVIFVLENGQADHFKERLIKIFKLELIELEKFLSKEYLTTWFNNIKPTLFSREN